MNQIFIDPTRSVGDISRDIFGGFTEHLGRCIYGGIYEPTSPFADEKGLRTDVMQALRRLQVPLIRYPGGNFVSGYRWMDGVGPKAERPARVDMAWNAIDTNHFGTNEFIDFCRKLNTEPYMVVNCGDGDMREARDWVEYCNGTQDTALVRLRRQHGYEAPHQVKYWGIGNEVDGHWQIGYKTPDEYSRAYLEFAKVMKWIDPSIKLIASAASNWAGGTVVERTQLLMEQASKFIDYLSIHWYVGNPKNNFNDYMALSELIEERLAASEGLIRALSLQQGIRPIPIAVDEWNVWYRTHPENTNDINGLEETYNLEDALMVAIQLNSFIRHANSVKMANIAQLVNAIAPIFTSPEGLVLQTIFYPFEVYSQTCGTTALDVFWKGETFNSSNYGDVRVLDVSATLDERRNRLMVYVVNRSQSDAMETTISLGSGCHAELVQAYVVNGPNIKAENTFANPDQVGVSEAKCQTEKQSTFNYTFEPHSVTALSFAF
ncbi:MAG: alpha-N-arabinofuranosidase [Anaerolineae bacterium]|nr:alpha-N-arabinofuranosidase [Anaerolineae bacterium]